jgi:hypothetical protein
MKQQDVEANYAADWKFCLNEAGDSVAGTPVPSKDRKTHVAVMWGVLIGITTIVSAGQHLLLVFSGASPEHPLSAKETHFNRLLAGGQIFVPMFGMGFFGVVLLGALSSPADVYACTLVEGNTFLLKNVDVTFSPADPPRRHAHACGNPVSPETQITRANLIKGPPPHPRTTRSGLHASRR